MPKLTKEQVAEVCENEGIGYAIQDYLSPGNIEDPDLASAVHNAHKAIKEVEDLLEGWGYYG